MLSQLFQSVRFFFKFYGFRGGVAFAWGLLRCNRESIYFADLTKQRNGLEAIANPKLDVRFIDTLEAFDLIAADYAAAKGELLALKDRKSLACGGNYLAVVYQDKSFAGWGQIKKGPVRYGNIRVSDCDCVIHKCRTLRAHRRQGVYVTLLARLQQILADKGLSKAYVGAKSFNKASLKGIEKAGFEFVEECNLGSFASRLWHHIRGKGPKVMQTGN